MSIHGLAVKCASYLARELGSDTREERRMAYGIEILLGEIVKTTLLLLLAWKLGLLSEVLCISVAAGVLRLASGGEHCSEYYRCLVGGTICFMLLGWGVHGLNVFFQGSGAYVTIGLSILLSWAILFKYAPGDTENRPINSVEERAKFKRLSLIITTIYGIAMIIFMNKYPLHPLVLPILVGMLEQAFTVSPWGYRFLHSVDGVLDFRKWSKKNYDSESADS